MSKFGDGRGVVISTLLARGHGPAWATFAGFRVFSGAALLCIVVGVVVHCSRDVGSCGMVGHFLADAISGAWYGIVYEGRCVV